MWRYLYWVRCDRGQLAANPGRIIRAQEEGVPAAEVLRFPPPSVHVAALQKVRAAFYGLGAKEGFEVVRALPGIAPSTRAAAQWARDKGVPNESGRVLQNFASAMSSL